MQQLHFISGLPRSGSTLLCNILNQNPRFWATATSGLPGIIGPIKNGWHDLAAHQAMPPNESYIRLQDTIRYAMSGYHARIDRPVVFDKSRAWLEYIQTLNALFTTREEGKNKLVKIITTVRDMPSIVASMEKRWRETLAVGQPMQQRNNYLETMTLEQRVNFWVRNDQLIGYTYLSLKNAYETYRDNLLLIEYDELTLRPHIALARIYEALGEEPFEHNFENVEQTTQEDDRVHRFVNLHNIRQKVAPNPTHWKDIIGDYGKALVGQEFWR